MSDIMQSLLSPVRAAVQRYHMIRPDDHIAVGVSGGKDSVLLLALLAQMQRFYPVPYHLTAITLDPCFDGKETDFTPIAGLCEQWNIPYILKRTRLGQVVFEDRKESNPCSLCARMRRGALHKAAKEAGCSAVALGHHMDDAAETMMMNLLSGGRIDCFSPQSYLSRRELWLIRPMIFLEEKEIASAVKRLNLPVVKSKCPVDGHTNRQQTKELIATLSQQYGPLNNHIVGAMQKAKISGW